MLAHSTRAVVGRVVVQAPRLGAVPIRSRRVGPWLVADAQRLLMTSGRPWGRINGSGTRDAQRRTYATTELESAPPRTSTARKTPTRTKRASKPKTRTTRKTATQKKTGTQATEKSRTTTRKRKSTAKARPKAKAKPKPKKAAAKRASAKQKKKKKMLTDEEKQNRKLRELSKVALKAPKLKPASAWSVYMVETVRSLGGGPSNLASSVRQASQGFKNLRPEELEHYNHIAVQNAQANEAVRQEWFRRHTPDQIRVANNARLMLTRKASKAGRFRFRLRDDRHIKRPLTGYVCFVKDRYASGDLKQLRAMDASRLIAREWRELPAGDKERYLAMGRAERQRYAQEHQAVFNRPPGRYRPRKTITETHSDTAAAAASSG